MTTPQFQFTPEQADADKTINSDAYKKGIPGFKFVTDGWNLGKDISSGNALGVGKDVAGTIADTTGFVSEAANAVSDPLNWLIQKGLGFLENFLFPLKDLLQLVTGDPAALKASAGKFDALAGELNQKAQQVQDTVAQGCSGWGGISAPAAGERLGTSHAVVEEAMKDASHLSMLLQISAMLMQAAYDILNGIIADVIEWMVVTWVAAQAAAVPTCGASEAAAAAATPGEVGIGVARATPKVAKTTSLLEKIMNVIRKLLAKIKEMFQAMAKGVGKTKMGKTFMDAEKGAGGKALGDLKNGATGHYIRDNLGKKIATSAKDRALQQVGVEKDPKNNLDAVAKGTAWAQSRVNQGVDLGTAVTEGTDPGAYSDYQNEHVYQKAPDTPAAPAQPQPATGGDNEWGFPTTDPDRPNG